MPNDQSCGVTIKVLPVTSKVMLMLTDMSNSSSVQKDNPQLVRIQHWTWDRCAVITDELQPKAIFKGSPAEEVNEENQPTQGSPRKRR